MRHVVVCLALVTAFPLALVADTLVLRNGTRLRGELLGIRNGRIEFEERSGYGRGRRLEFDRDEVVRIEFDDPREASRDGAPVRPFGMRERTAIVNSNSPWTDTSVDVREGQTIYFSPQGEVRWGPDRRDGPQGERNSPSNPNRPMPNRPAAALIGKIGAERTTTSSSARNKVPFACGRPGGCISASTTTITTTTRARSESSSTTNPYEGRGRSHSAPSVFFVIEFG